MKPAKCCAGGTRPGHIHRPRIPPAFLAAVLVLMLASSFAGRTFAKDFSFPEVNIDARVLPDGSMEVLERRSYGFSGEFHWASWWIPSPRRQTVKILSLAEPSKSYAEGQSESPGTYQVSRGQDRVDVKWFYSAKDEVRTFEIRYLVENAVTVYDDGAELYWKFIGDGWDKKADKVEVTVRLPDGTTRSATKAWAHGPLWGIVEILDDHTVRLSVDGLPPSTFVEARLVFDKSLVPHANAVKRGASVRSILEEEARWAEEANRKREAARALLARRHAGVRYGLVAAAAMALFTFAYMYSRWLVHDREYRPDFTGDYYRELPASYTPAELGVLWRYGYVGTLDLSATLLDLVRRGYLEVEEVRTGRSGILGTGKREEYDYIFRKTGSTGKALAQEEKLLKHEAAAVEMLFDFGAENGEASIKRLEKYAKKHPDQVRSRFEEWKKSVKEAAEKHRFFEKPSPTASAAGLAVGLGLVVIGLAAAPFTVGLSAVAGTVSGGAVILQSYTMVRRSRKAANEFAMWKAFRRFLEHFSNLDDAPMLSLAIWEHYLVYAVTLGVADKVIEQLKTILPEAEAGTGPGSFTRFHGLYSASGLSAFTSLASSIESAMAIAASPSSSASGGGGGFSSGGGGGGGGGGGSAG